MILSSSSPRNAYPADRLKEAAKARIGDVLRDLCGVPVEAIRAAEARNQREFPCPKCGGTTRFRVMNLEEGRVRCSHCCRDKSEGSGDVYDAIMWRRDCKFPEALKTLREYLNGPDVSSSPRRPETTSSGAAPKRGGVSIKTIYPYFDENGVEVFRTETETFPGTVDPTKGKPKKKALFGPVVDGVFEPKAEYDKAAVIPFHLPELLDATRRTVCVVEGEKCAVALTNLFKRVGIEAAAVATTFPFGSNGVRLWAERVGTLRGRDRVFYFADADEPGEEAARSFAKIVVDAGIDAKIVVFRPVVGKDGETVEFERPGGKGKTSTVKGYDVADWLDDLRPVASQKPANDRAAFYATAFDELTAESSPFVFSVSSFAPKTSAQNDQKSESPQNSQSSEITAPVSSPGFVGDGDPVERRKERERAKRIRSIERELAQISRPFPFDSLPPVLRDFVGTVAAANGVEAGPLALACLCVASSVCGFRARLKHNDWARPVAPTLNLMVVGEPGAGKTPLLGEALAPLEKLEKRAWRQYRRNGGDGGRPYYLERDATPEALIENVIDASNLSRRLYAPLYHIEEAAALFNFEKSGRANGVYGSLIKLDGGGPLTVSRKTATRRFLRSEEACCALVGEVQPGPLSRGVKKEKSAIDQGFIYRPAWVYLSRRPIKRTKYGETESQALALARNGYGAFVGWLDALKPEESNDVEETEENGEALANEEDEEREKPRLLFRFSKEAHEVEYNDFRDEINAEVDRLEDEGLILNAVFRQKGEYFVVRLALLLHICEYYGTPFEALATVEEIPPETVRRAVEVVRWIWSEFDRCFRTVAAVDDSETPQSAGKLPVEELVLEFIEKFQTENGRGPTAREISKEFSVFAKSAKNIQKRDRLLNELRDKALIEGVKRPAPKNQKECFEIVRLPAEPELETEEDDD